MPSVLLKHLDGRGSDVHVEGDSHRVRKGACFSGPTARSLAPPRDLGSAAPPLRPGETLCQLEAPLPARGGRAG